MTRSQALSFLIGMVCSTSACGSEPGLSALHVPAGFIIERCAAEADAVYPMFAAFDERGRLFVAESSGLDLYAELKAQTRKCRIRVLEDPDERGVFKKASVFADKLVFPMGLVWRDGKLFVADPPDLVALEDTDGDGRADRRTVILTGFGHVDNGSLHGLTFGPDGRLYMTMGQPDGYTIKRKDGVTVRGTTGALLRCRPDGSDPEVLCRGFENLVEAVFTPRGDILGTVNWFQRPSGGLRDALVHLVDGGLYPIVGDRGTPQPVTGDYLPAASMFPAVALSGLELYRGQAFPGMQGQVFSAQHNSRKLGRHVIVPHGATFRTQDFDFVTSDSPDFHPSDVLEDADGSLIVVDTGSWYVQHCPTGQIRKVKATGGIYRVRGVGAPATKDPRGLRIDWSRAGADELTLLLRDGRPAVRDRAQQTLSRRGATAVEALATVLSNAKADLQARQHALWALAGMDAEASLPPLRAALDCADSDIVIPAARALGLRRDRRASRQLDKLLAHKELSVRLASAEALARCEDAASLPALWRALTEAEVDRFLELALIHALFHRADVAALETALRDPHPRVQQAALILLDQPPRPRDQLRYDQVVERLRSPDAALRQAAVRSLRGHPEWAGQSLDLLRGLFEQPVLKADDERSLRELTLAYQASPEIQGLLGQILADDKSNKARRVLALEAMAQSSLPKPPAPWIKALDQVLSGEGPPEVRLQAARTSAALQAPQLDDTLARLADHADAPAELRLEALRAVALRRPTLSGSSARFVAAALTDEERPLARLIAAEIIGRAHLTDEQLRQALPALRQSAVISPSVVLASVLRTATPASAPQVAEYLEEAIRNGWRPSDQELALTAKQLVAAGASASALAEQARKIGDVHRQRVMDNEPLLKGGDPARGRAVFFGGKTACATCHRIGAEGGTIGPDLTKLGVIRAGRDILESILVPSSTIAQGYDPYVVVTTEGKTLHGVIARQTAELVVLRDASGAELHLRQDRIQEMRRAATSIMPEGLERALSRDELRDLLAFLQGQR